jgi:hypothetical protein
MNWMQFVVAISGSLAWPVAVLTILVVLKRTKS